MGRGYMPIGRRERARQDKRERITAAARELFAEHGVSGVTTQQIADPMSRSMPPTRQRWRA